MIRLENNCPGLTRKVLVCFFAALISLPPSLDVHAQVLDTGPPYERELLRLSEILGAVHRLRNLCGFEDGQTWRSRMEQLLDAENPSPRRRAQLVEAFNRGFEGFDLAYRDCTPAAEIALERYMEEGHKLSGLIVDRYAN